MSKVDIVLILSKCDNPDDIITVTFEINNNNVMFFKVNFGLQSEKYVQSINCKQNVICLFKKSDYIHIRLYDEYDPNTVITKLCSPTLLYSLKKLEGVECLYDFLNNISRLYIPFDSRKPMEQIHGSYFKSLKSLHEKIGNDYFITNEFLESIEMNKNSSLKMMNEKIIMDPHVTANYLVEGDFGMMRGKSSVFDALQASIIQVKYGNELEKRFDPNLPFSYALENITRIINLHPKNF